MTKTIWVSTSAATTYVPREKPIQETVAPFTSQTSGAAPATTSLGTNSGQRILAVDGTWIPQPAFSSGGADQIETLRPSVVSPTYSANPPTVTDPSYAYDVDTNHATTAGEWSAASEARINGRLDIFTFITWAAKVQTWTSATINISRAYSTLTDGESSTGSKTSSVLFEYSTNNGGSWTTLGTDTQSSIPTAPQTLSASITTSPTMNSIIVKVTMTRGGGGTIYEDGIALPGLTGAIDLKLFDIWIDGVYAGGAGNITCNNLTVTGDATLQNKLYDGSGSAGTAGYILSSTGTKTAWIPDSVGSGTVTSITTTGANGVTISGGSTQTITTSGTFALALGAITPTSISTGTGYFSGDVEFASSIKSPNGSNSPVTIAPDGTGDLHLNTHSMRLGDHNANATIATNGTGDLILTTHEGSGDEGIVRLYDGANGNITLTPNGTGQVQVGTDQVVTLAASQTLTNKSISGSTNTLSNIANASLTNSTISGVALGSNLNALTISSPLTGTSFNGSAAVSIGIPVATTSASGYLSSADWTTFNSKLSPSDTYYIGTTSNAFNRSSAAQSLTGVSIDGSAPAGSLTGSTLASGVTASSLTSVGTLGSLTVSGNASLATTSGSVGVGTAAGSAKLTVIGSAAKLYVDLSGENYYDASVHSFRNFAGSEGMRLNSTGLGIGTASPSTKLHVSNAGVSAQATFVGTTGSPYITVVGNSGTTILGNESNGGWVGTTGSQSFVFKTTDIERVRIDTSGNVGIGTASPSYRLHVSASDTSNVVGGSAAAINISNSNAAAFGRTVDLDFSVGGGASAERIAGLSAVYTSYGTSVGGALAFCTNNGSSSFAERMRITSGGDVGIGTASPSQKLHIAGTTANILLAGTSNSYVTVNIGATNIGYLGDANWMFGGSSSDFGIRATNNLVFGTSFYERMRIDSSGNVGIGTASPTVGLHVVKDQGSGYIAAFRSNVSSPYITFQTTSGITQIQGINSAFTATNDIAMQLSGGNVGIGTSSTTFKLDVQGSSAGYLEAVRFKNTNAAGYLTTSWTVGSAEATIRYFPGTFFKIGPDSGDTTTPILFATNNGTERMRIDSTQVKATVPFIGNSGTKGFGGITTTTSTSTPTGGSSGDHYYIY